LFLDAAGAYLPMGKILVVCSKGPMPRPTTRRSASSPARSGSPPTSAEPSAGTPHGEPESVPFERPPAALLGARRVAHREAHEFVRPRQVGDLDPANTEYLARELAGIRLALGEMPTRDYLAEELDRLRTEVGRLQSRLEVDGQAGRVAVDE
jgi:hypothetical protein